MNRIPLDSTVISSAGYDADQRVLELQFVTTGAVYQYAGVPVEVFGQLLAAESHGSYFNAFIRGVYRYVTTGEVGFSNVERDQYVALVERAGKARRDANRIRFHSDDFLAGAMVVFYFMNQQTNIPASWALGPLIGKDPFDGAE